MGCKSSKEPTNQLHSYLENLKEKIDSDNFSVPRPLISQFESKINEKLVRTDNLEFSPLAYALYKGKYKSFRYIHEILNGSLATMEKLLIDQKIHPLILCCSHGNLDLFRFYFSTFTSHGRLSKSLQEHHDRHLDLESEKIIIIHQAVLSGFISIVEFLHGLAGTMNNAPDYLNIHYINPETGENAALVACRSGSYVMIKYIYGLGANFHIRNKKTQNAVQILAAGKGNRGEICECLEFLVLEVKIEFWNCYEEVLICLEDKSAIRFLERQLEKRGVYVTREEIEAIYGGTGLEFRENRDSDMDKLSFMSLASQASVFGTLNHKDNF